MPSPGLPHTDGRIHQGSERSCGAGDDLLPSMFGSNAGYLLIRMASERDKEGR
jgi:hypothetical protein